MLGNEENTHRKTKYLKIDIYYKLTKRENIQNFFPILWVTRHFFVSRISAQLM